MTTEIRPEDIIDFWMEAGPQKWFAKDDVLDAEIARRFADAHKLAATGDLDHWSSRPEGALALILLLDQFSRNLHRGRPDAFAQDARARALAIQAIESGLDRQVPEALRQFFYLPFEHSEQIADQMLAVRYCHSVDAETLRWAKIHEAIIRRFGRFPHRNEALGRHTTPTERDFLSSGGFGG